MHLYNLHFLNQQLLWLLAVLPPLVILLGVYAYRRQRRYLEDYGDWRLIHKNSVPVTAFRYAIKTLSLTVAVTALVIALARPAEENAKSEYPIGTVDAVAIVDVSRSMAIPDYQGMLTDKSYENGTRLDMARWLLLHDIVPALGYNQLGVVAFSGSAFPKAFLTDDMPALKWQMDHSLGIGSVPGDGSQLATALSMAALLFDLDSPPTHRRVVILFSDGGNDSEDAKTIAAMKELKKRNIDLIIAGLGSNEPHAVPIRMLPPSDQAQNYGQEFYMLDGQIAKSARDEAMLLAVKNAIGGRYVRVDRPSDFHIGSLISGVDIKYIRGEKEYFIYPLYLAAFMTVLAWFVPREIARRSRKKPQSGAPKSGSGSAKERTKK